MLLRYTVLIAGMVLTSLCQSVAGAEVDLQADEETLRRAGLPTDGPSLLALFRKRTPDTHSQARIQSLIAQLGSDAFEEREEASEELVACGVTAVGLLRKAAHHADLEIRRRARDALALIEQKDLSPDVLIAALHVLSCRKPAQMTEVLLNYAPYATDADLIEELSGALTSAALVDPRNSGPAGNADPQLLQALTDSSPIKRILAGEALCRTGCRRQLPAVRRLLCDTDLQVRRHIALALLEAHDKSAVPVLIELLAELPLAEAEHLESILLQLAGNTAPKESLDDQPKAATTEKADQQAAATAERCKSCDAWKEWWKQHGQGLDLTKVELSPKWRGYVLALCMTTLRGRGAGGGRSGCLLEFDALGRIRWQIKGLAYPVDAQVLDERRVLVTEYRAGQVTERNHNGDILRCINVPDLPLEAQRLPNGNILITTRNRVFEINRNDKEVWATNGNRGDTIVAACPLRGGEIGICHLSGMVIRMDRSGKMLSSFRAGRLFRPYGVHIQGLPNGHILVPLYYDNKIVEFDKEGREVWSAPYPRPICAQRLPNGRTLVASYGGNSFAELDSNGREVKSQHCDIPLMNVRGR